MVVESPVSFTFSNRDLPISHTPLLVVNSAGSSTTPPPPHPRQPVVRHLSTPLETLHSPLRHHRRTASVGRPPVRETLNASLSYEDEDGIRVNQYLIKQEIGRGSYGAVHLAVDQTGQKFAVKEFSKSRLRKRSQSQILRRPHHARRIGGILNMPPAYGRSASEIHRQEEAGNPLYLIREEIAILKKLDHENVVHLIEVLDDPEGDSLYMVLEMCEKGVVMKVGLDDTAEPYPEEKCRLWFRDMILGIEYLHSQGVVHRDIKPDNLLLSKDDVLKIVDFGVSEMFEKKSQMLTAKSAGSPAFLPPELCVSGHGDVSGTATDIWAMGVTLYCLLFGKLPFSHSGVVQLYESIKNDEPFIPEDLNPDAADLLRRLLEKDPDKRIKMPELREHPWVTRRGEDMLLPEEENTSEIIPSPTPEDVASAITRSIRNVMAVVKAVQKLKRLTLKRFKHPYLSAKDGPLSIDDLLSRPKSYDQDNRKHLEQKLAVSGVTKDMSVVSISQTPQKPSSPFVGNEDTEMADNIQCIDVECHNFGISDTIDSPMEESPPLFNEVPMNQAISPLGEEPHFLQIGVGSEQPAEEASRMISESPPPTEKNVYAEAYREDVARIMEERGQSATIYLTKWVE
ncbi:Pkinase-domain-containing protein [Choiromyces venosus 120613-1]|uniref:Pkinase-domain-containing protein n=1 Tax=Choiromyces venosus 120613-1 TaxID=1336337 RepID=A0A3N4K5D3_9PEZI|nr:Pkinase-domain-containing protein [Choiromyces venosus 120613-1]